MRRLPELIQFPWSPFCIVQRRILEFSGAKFKITNIPSGDRALVWRLTRSRYYGVPVIRDGAQTVFETDHDSQVVAKYLDDKLGLGLFPRELEGVQSILWRYLENDVEEMTFKLNDIHWEEIVPKADRLVFLRHKERRFGRGCLEKWRQEEKALLAELTRRLLAFDEMLIGGPYLLGDRPRFVDFDLLGMLDNFLYSGHYRLPGVHRRLKAWHGRMAQIKIKQFA
jgi:glutathione S-transferase